MEHIIIADDHSMIRKGLKLLLMSRLGCKNIYEAESNNALMNELKKGQCTHIILDVILSDGISLEVVPVIRKLYPHVKLMIYTMQPYEIYADAFKQYDVHFYLAKSSSEETAVTYIKKFLANDIPVHHTPSPIHNNPFSSLTARELEILHYLLNGYKTNDIAKALNLSSNTVSTFKKRIFEKTGSSSLAQLFEMSSVNNLSIYVQSAKTD